MAVLEIAELKEGSFIQSNSVYYASTLKRIKKESNTLRPIFEAFSNAWESFENLKKTKQPQITITIDLKNNEIDLGHTPKFSFDKITIKDNGCGFTDENFSRFLILDDNSKSPANKGAGRIQFLHFFDKTEFSSIFEKDGKFYERKFTLSKSPIFLRENAITKYESTKETNKFESGTTVIFYNPLVQHDKEYYENLDAGKLAERLIRNFMLKFCNSINSLPQIKIYLNVNEIQTGEKEITINEIPSVAKEFEINIPYKKREQGIFKITDKSEKIVVKTFLIPSRDLDKNKIVLTAKNECTNSEVAIQCFSEKDIINSKRYMFLLSSTYFDEKATTNRGKIELYSQKDFSSDENNLFEEEMILLDDLTEETNKRIPEEFTEIKEKQDELELSIDKLKEMFLLKDNAIKAAKLKVGDNDETMLKKIYQYDCEVMAKKDAELKKVVDALEKIDTSSSDYEVRLEKEINHLVQNIPIQNRTSLTQYVARRQLILRQFQLILDRKLEVQQNPDQRNNDEKLLHNLIFQQHSTETEKSALWLVNEDFIYFKGCSEEKLCDITFAGEKVFREEITEKELEYLHEFGETREAQRPDIMLFPAENKAIIIEFKAPDVNVSKHLSQIQNYASLMLNYCKPEYKLTTFYGYLIGENIETLDVRHRDPTFVEAYNFDYLYRPAYSVVNDAGTGDGTIYTEVIKYSTLLKRALKRNEIYKKHLGIDSECI